MFECLKSRKTIVRHIIEEKLQMPAKIEYMNRVLDSCTNREQAKFVSDWARNVIENYENLAVIKSKKYLGLWHEIVGFMIDFMDEFRKFNEKMSFYYVEKCKTLPK